MTPLKTLSYASGRAEIVEENEMKKLKVKITDINEGDAYYGEIDNILKEVFTLDPADVMPSTAFGEDWLKGSAKSSNERYFFAGFKYEEVKS